MGYKQIRVSQLIAPFGPGSLYTDRRGVPHVVAGLDLWHKEWNEALGKMVSCTQPEEFNIFEPRLSALLGVDRFCSPPDHRYVSKNDSPPPNANLYIPALRFPRWYRNTRTGEMRRFNLNTVRLSPPSEGGRWQPVRFISVCSAGHLCEFPWKEWIGCNCKGDGNLFLTDRGGSELTSVKIECHSCPEGSTGRKGKNLANTTIKPDSAGSTQSAFQRAGIDCPGDRPWLGEDAFEANCGHPLVGALINQINIYFPRTISAISLPDLKIEDDEVTRLRNEIERDPGALGVAKTLWNMQNSSGAVALVQDGLTKRGIESDQDKINEALKSLFSQEANQLPPGSPVPSLPESELLSFRRAEYNILCSQIDDPENIPDLRVIPESVPKNLSEWVESINLVERLRETRAFYGFDRLESIHNPLTDLPESAMNQLFRKPPVQHQDRWLPAVKVFGEGIFLRLSEKRISEWRRENSDWLTRRLHDRFITRLDGIHQILPPSSGADRNWASRYLLVHTLAHIFINQLVFECGYSTAALRERLYVSDDIDAPMAALLIYTAAGDSEGTLGGLVRLGRPKLFGSIAHRAIGRASWCSADPVCSEHLGGQGSRLANLAACHACTLLPETSCETINHGLDRAMVVGTPYDRDVGFMSGLLTESEAYTLG